MVDQVARTTLLYLAVGAAFIPTGILYALLRLNERAFWQYTGALFTIGFFTARYVWSRLSRTVARHEPEHGVTVAPTTSVISTPRPDVRPYVPPLLPGYATGGLTAIEYGLIAALLAVLIVAALILLGGALGNIFGYTGNTVNNDASGVP